jgi:hypothetical protein
MSVKRNVFLHNGIDYLIINDIINHIILSEYGGVMFSTNKIKILFVAVAFFPSHASLFAQEVDPKIRYLRALSVENIQSMVSGTDQNISSPLNGIPKPIQEADSKTFYAYVLKENEEKALKKFRKYGLKKEVLEQCNIAPVEGVVATACVSSPTKKKDVKRKKPSSVMVRRARNVFNSFAEKPIPVFEEKDEDSPAAATDDAVYVDEQHMKKYKVGDQRFIFAHEAVHNIKKHNSKYLLIEKLLKEKNGKLTPEMERDLNYFGRCQETESDVMGTVVGGLDLAKGYIGFAEKQVERECDSDKEIITVNATNDTHPHGLHRLREAVLLNKELELLAETKEKK